VGMAQGGRVEPIERCTEASQRILDDLAQIRFLLLIARGLTIGRPANQAVESRNFGNWALSGQYARAHDPRRPSDRHSTN
ncbi:MAG TPA: hypothetical protein PLE50_05370, partial [Rhabdaerophilum sp.]|nr:hypothetical protein [Rhabdaerophilum sp.]